MKSYKATVTIISLFLVSTVIAQSPEQYKKWETSHYKSISEFEQNNQQALAEGSPASIQEYNKRLMASIAKDPQNPLLLKRAGDLMAFQHNQSMVSEEEISYYVSKSKNATQPEKKVIDALLKKFDVLNTYSLDAERYYKLAADLGESESAIALVQFYRQGYFRFMMNLPFIIYQVNDKSISYLTKALNLGNEFAALILAEIYMLGEDEIKPDLLKADQFIKETSDPAQAYYLLGINFLDTERAYKNEAGLYIALSNAVSCLTKASELGNVDAAYYLGLVYSGKYDLSDFKRKDDDKAFLYFKKSAVDEKQTPEAYYSLANCYIEGIGTAKNLKAGIEMMEKLLKANTETIDKGSLIEVIEKAKKQL